MIDGNKLGVVGFEKLGTPYSVMDCQAFIEWCLRQCGCDKDLAGSNAWYRECLKHGRVLTPEQCVKELGCVPRGAFLFIHAFDGGEEKRGYHDGLGNASHIGICTRKGEGAIHSSQSRGGVFESAFHEKTINGGWNAVGLWSSEVCYDYGKNPSPAPTPTPAPEPEPLPQPEIAIVYADNGRPVNFRKRASLQADLIDKIPCGEQVKVLVENYSDEWSKIRWHNKVGYMVTKFLRFEDDEPADELVTVILHNIPMADANSLKSVYPDNTEIVEGRG